jgi:hypothetical protein
VEKINDGQQNYCRKSCLRFRPLTEASGTAGPVQNRGMQILTDALCVCWPTPAGERPVFLRC